MLTRKILWSGMEKYQAGAGLGKNPCGIPRSEYNVIFLKRKDNTQGRPLPWQCLAFSQSLSHGEALRLHYILISLRLLMCALKILLVFGIKTSVAHSVIRIKKIHSFLVTGKAWGKWASARAARIGESQVSAAAPWHYGRHVVPEGLIKMAVEAVLCHETATQVAVSWLATGSKRELSGTFCTSEFQDFVCM